MRALYVMYDPRCGLCTEAKTWLVRQRPYVRLVLLASGPERAGELFPQLPPGELAVVSDSGQAWLGDRAFLMCLWALKDYRRWARRLASPTLLPLARQAFATISRNRRGISRMLGLASEAALRDRFQRETIPPCLLP